MNDLIPPSFDQPTKPTKRRGIFAEHFVRRLWQIAAAVAAFHIVYLLVGSTDEPNVQIARACRATAFCIGAFVIAYVSDLLSRPE
jgi:hypothetical protein